MKTFGANIRCSVCDAQPWPDNPATTRETFDLARIGADWFCEQHRQSRKRVSRAAAVTPTGALNEFERTLTDLTARLEAAFAGSFDLSEDDRNDVYDAFAAYREEIARDLNEVKTAIATQEPPPDQSKPKRPARKRITSAEHRHEKQGEPLATSLVANTEDDAS